MVSLIKKNYIFTAAQYFVCSGLLIFHEGLIWKYGRNL